MYWWQRWPGRLEHELAELDRAGMRYQVDQGLFDCGILRIDVEVDLPGETVVLDVLFPDLYPSFRFEVYAPQLRLAHHQNPLEGNICLLGRRSDNWRSTDTLAGLLQAQLPEVLRTGRSNADAAAIGGAEERQAEPLSVYYPYAPGIVLTAIGGGDIDVRHRGGRFMLGTVPGPQGPPPRVFVRGAVLEVMADGGAVLAAADDALRRAFTGTPLRGRWARVDRPIIAKDAGQFLAQLLRDYPAARDAPVNRVDGGHLQIWGVLFPEETAQRQLGEGWVFACNFDEKFDRLLRAQQELVRGNPLRRH